MEGVAFDGVEDAFLNIPVHAARREALRVALAAPQRAVAAGQILALYDGEVCLGGGAITAARTSL